MFISTYYINVLYRRVLLSTWAQGLIKHQKGDWKHVGLSLKLDQATLKNIELDSQHHAERAFNMLSEWLKRDTTSCYCKLISAMSEQGLESGVKVLKEKIKLSRLSWMTRLLETHLTDAYHSSLHVILPSLIYVYIHYKNTYIMRTLFLTSKCYSFHHN